MSARADTSRFTLIDRALSREEAKAISAAIRETPNILGYSVKELLSFGECLIAETASGEMAGICVMKRIARQWSELVFLIVLPAYRKQGIGAALFREAFRRLSAHGDTVLCISREASILRLMEEVQMQFLPEWRLPFVVHLAKMRHYANFYRFREGFRKGPMYQGQPPFRYAVKRNQPGK